MAKIWNITDHPKTNTPGVTRMVLGRQIRPGRYIKVPDERLVGAHKLMADVQARNLHIGERPPKDYLLAKKPPRIELADGVTRAHGPDKSTPAKKLEVKVETKVEVKETAEANVEESAATDEKESYKDSKRGRSRRG